MGTHVTGIHVIGKEIVDGKFVCVCASVCLKGWGNTAAALAGLGADMLERREREEVPVVLVLLKELRGGALLLVLEVAHGEGWEKMILLLLLCCMT